MEVCEQDPEPGYHGATVTCFANEIAGKEFRDVFQQVGLTEDDIVSATGRAEDPGGSRSTGTTGSTHKTGRTVPDPCGYKRNLTCGSEGEDDFRIKGNAHTGTRGRAARNCGSLSANLS